MLEDLFDHMIHAIKVCAANHIAVGADNPTQEIVLTPAQKATFDADVARRKQLGISAPREDRMPFVPG